MLKKVKLAVNILKTLFYTLDLKVSSTIPLGEVQKSRGTVT